MADIFTVQKEMKLLEFLFINLVGWSKKSVKQRLQGSSVVINSNIITKHDFRLNIGDSVEVGVTQRRTNQSRNRVEIIYQDRDIIAINKPARLLSVADVKENKQHALAILRTQLTRGKNSIKLWPVHRLDRDTSGILLFATSKEMREAIMSNWSSAEKIYLAIVEGIPKEDKMTIDQPLRVDEKEYRMHVGKHPNAKSAITHYTIKQKSPKSSLLEVKIDTGRQHQIRAHLSWLGHSIIGDERYGTKGSRMGLHSKRVKIIDPRTKESLEFEIDAPKDFYGLL